MKKYFIIFIFLFIFTPFFVFAEEIESSTSENNTNISVETPETPIDTENAETTVIESNNSELEQPNINEVDYLPDEEKKEGILSSYINSFINHLENEFPSDFHFVIPLIVLLVSLIVLSLPFILYQLILRFVRF